MPIQVDHDERRRQIIGAATQVLGELGFARFTLRAVGNRLGGSVTMVTHYFRTRTELLDGLLASTLEDARKQQQELAGIVDPHDRLEAVIRYFLPIGEENLAIERARVALSSHRNAEPLIEDHLNQIEPGMREVVRSGLRDLIPDDHLEDTVDLIRLWTGGVVLATIEHPEIWTPERQERALDQFMKLIELPVAAR